MFRSRIYVYKEKLLNLFNKARNDIFTKLEEYNEKTV